MFGSRRKSAGFGLQIQDHQIKLAAIAGSGNRFKLLRSHTVQLPEGVIKEGRMLDEEAVQLVLRQMVHQLGLRGSRVVLTIPTSSVILRRSTLPMLRDQELRNLIDVELHSGNAQLPFKNPVFDFVRAGQNEEGVEVVIFASPEEIVSQYVDATRNAGLVPVAVDLAPLSLFRILHRLLDTMDAGLPERFMILSAESEVVEISIYANGYPVFFRSIPVQVRALLDDDTDYLEAYGRYFSVELARVINYYKYSVAPAEEDTIDMLYLIGDTHFAEGIIPILEQEFTCGVKLMDIHSLINTTDQEMPSYAVPIGLAMKGA